MGFGPKVAIFRTFFLGNFSQKKVFYDILERKNAFRGYKNKKFKKSKNWHFSKGVNPWFWSKNGHFSNFYFLGNIGQENVFYDILERKDAFLGYKNKKFKKSKNCHFSKGVSPWFWSKIGHFSIVEKKSKQKLSKKIVEKKSKNWDFSKGVSPWFWSKIGHFSIFFLKII